MVDRRGANKVSADANLILEVAPYGEGLVLDLGGGKGTLQQPLAKLGYQYVNLDAQHRRNGQPTVMGDAHTLPFMDAAFDLVVSKDTLEHFLQPWAAIKEVYRVLKPDGLFLIWVPFMHGFHGDDFYRYTPLGLRYLLSDFEIVSFESPLSVFTVIGLIVIEITKRIHLGFLDPLLKRICYRLDRVIMRYQRGPSSIAAGYRIVARKSLR